MGEFIIYYRGKIVGGIYDDRLLVKPTKSAISYMPTVTYELLCNLLRGWEAAMAVKERTTIALDPEVKREATDVLERMGLSLSSFTEICLRQAVRDKGMPFTPSLRPVRSDGYPVPPAHDAYRFERSKSTGNIVLPQEWDDPADDIYDHA